MEKHIIKINWEGPWTVKEIIQKNNHGGTKQDNWAGRDYGLYKIFGKHILYGRDVLLYIGQAVDQTFSQRFRQHYKEWLKDEGEGIKIYLGYLEAEKYDDKNNWYTWRWDIDTAEAILVYKYTPCYNSVLKGDYPKLGPFKSIHLLHSGQRRHLRKTDKAPKDYH
jgi:hypothetical protein